MSNVPHSRVPILDVNPYQDRPSYKLKEAQEVCYEGRKYRILIYENQHHLGWQIVKGIQALLATVFTLFIGLAFKGVQNLWSQAFSGKEVKIIKLAEKSPEAQAFANAHPQIVEAPKEAVKPADSLPRVKAPGVKEIVKPAPIGLAATGGFANAGLSCYIGATLQCVKNIPAFWTLLKQETHPLAQKANESLEKFQLRLQIRQHILQVLTASKGGTTVSAQDMSALWNLLTHYDPFLIPARQSGDPREFWTVLCSILQIPYVKEEPPFYNLLAVADRPGEFFTNLQKVVLNIAPPILPATLAYTPDRALVAIEPAAEIKLQCGGQLVTYRFAGFVQAAPGHAIAFVKEAGANSWVKFDDARVSPLSTIPEKVKQSISMFFYEKV